MVLAVVVEGLGSVPSTHSSGLTTAYNCSSRIIHSHACMHAHTCACTHTHTYTHYIKGHLTVKVKSGPKHGQVI